MGVTDCLGGYIGYVLGFVCVFRSQSKYACISGVIVNGYLLS